MFPSGFAAKNLTYTSAYKFFMKNNKKMNKNPTNLFLSEAIYT